MNTYPIAFTELTTYTGPYKAREKGDFCVTVIVLQLGNTVHRAIVSFYDLPLDKVPYNSVYSTDFHVNLPLQSLGGFMSLIQHNIDKLQLEWDANNYRANFVLK